MAVLLSFSMQHHLLPGADWSNTTMHCTKPRRYFQEYKQNVKNIKSILKVMYVTSHSLQFVEIGWF